MERIVRSIFPDVTVFFIYVILGFGFSFISKLDLTNSGFWIAFLIYIPLPIYLIVIKPFIESKIYITAIEFDQIRNQIKIEYLEFQRKKYILIEVKEMKYNIFNSYKMSLADRIIFFEGEKEVFTQYCNTAWTVARINEVSQSLKKIGIKKPRGYNK